MSAYLKLSVRDAVKVGGTTLPGILTSLTVDGSLEVTQDKLEGSSTHITSVEGYTTANVALDIVLHGTDSQRETQLRTINGVFMVNPPEGQTKGKATAWRVVNPHLDARRIRQMLFTKFSSRDGNEDETTVVSLEFREILQEQARLEKAAEQEAATSAETGELEMPGLGGSGTPGAGADPSKPPEPLNPFLQGFKDGQAVVNPPPSPAPTPRPGEQVIEP